MSRVFHPAQGLRLHATKLILLVVFAAAGVAHAQYELPDEIFQRTILIRHGSEQATAFKFEQGGRIYLVTTRHFAKNLPAKKAVVQRWHNQAWNDLATVRTVFPADQDVDLAILETDERIAQPYTVVRSSEVLTTGQKVWFMGWAFDPIKLPPQPKNMPQSLRPIFPEIPMVSIGTITAIEPTRPDSIEIRIQKLAGSKIAAGPMVYWSPVHRDYEVLAVVKRDDQRAVMLPGGEVPKTSLLRGYGIDLVAETITAGSRGTEF
ncbi:MAG TPA: hypothetical protein VGG04_01085 [Candidatus Sulfotelmatobacter sp.]|jgi:hypothetical protein